MRHSYLAPDVAFSPSGRMTVLDRDGRGVGEVHAAASAHDACITTVS